MKLKSKSGTYHPVDGKVYPIEMLLPLMKEEFLTKMKSHPKSGIHIAVDEEVNTLQIHNGCGSSNPDKLIEYNLYKALLELMEKK